MRNWSAWCNGHKRTTRRCGASDSVLYMEPRRPPTHGEHNFELLKMANKSCRCSADVSSLHTQVTSVATQMPRKACIICQQGLAPERKNLWRHALLFSIFHTEVWWKNTYLGRPTYLWFQKLSMLPLAAKRVSGYPRSSNLSYAKGRHLFQWSFPVSHTTCVAQQLF